MRFCAQRHRRACFFVKWILSCLVWIGNYSRKLLVSYFILLLYSLALCLSLSFYFSLTPTLKNKKKSFCVFKSRIFLNETLNEGGSRLGFWPIGSSGGTRGTIRQKSSSGLSCRRPLLAVLAWAEKRHVELELACKLIVLHRQILFSLAIATIATNNQNTLKTCKYFHWLAWRVWLFCE